MILEEEKTVISAQLVKPKRSVLMLPSMQLMLMTLTYLLQQHCNDSNTLVQAIKIFENVDFFPVRYINVIQRTEYHGTENDEYFFSTYIHRSILETNSHTLRIV